MKTIIRNTDHIAVYVGNHLALTADGVRGPDWIDQSLTSSSATMQDLTLPDGFVAGAYAYDGQWSIAHQELIDAETARKSEAFTGAIASLVLRIDSDADAIYAAALGNRATEYTQAEDQATAFRANNYEGDAPSYVQAWADATANSPQWAADNIIATADAWRTAQAQIRAMRLLCKQQAKAATTHAALDAVAANWTAFIVQIKEALKL